jgi:hypothetical protein
MTFTNPGAANICHLLLGAHTIAAGITAVMDFCMWRDYFRLCSS